MDDYGPRMCGALCRRTRGQERTNSSDLFAGVNTRRGRAIKRAELIPRRIHSEEAADDYGAGSRDDKGWKEGG